MNIKLHNKFEIIQGDQTFVAYNTLTHNILDAIANFENYTAYFVFGTGTGNVTYQDNKMSSYSLSMATSLEEIQCDISRGDLFVKRTVTINENEHVGLEFCELGMSSSGQANPNICNHVQIKNQNGEVIKIVKKSGQVMFIRLTVYLEVDNIGKGYLCAGENNLLKAILGEYSGKNFVAKRGYITSSNTANIYRNVPRTAESYDCAFVSSVANNTATFNIDVDINTGETMEMVYLLGGSPVIRYSLEDQAVEETKTETFETQQGFILPLEKNIKTVNSVLDENDQPVTGYYQKQFAKEFGDYIKNPFLSTISAQDARWVSEDGDKIAFLSGGSLYFYKNSNYEILQLTANVPADGVTKIIMFEDKVFVIYSIVPHVRMYQIVDGVLVEQSVDFSAYENFDTTYAWQDVRVIELADHNFLFGAILGSASRNPVVITASFANNTLTVLSASYGQSDYIVSMFSLYKSNFYNSMIGFVTNNYNGQENNYRIEEYYINGHYDVTHQFQAYYFLNDTISMESKSRAVILRKSQSPYLWLYYYPNVYRYSINLTASPNNWISTDLMYIAQKFEENGSPVYKFYNLTKYNNPEEFEGGLPSDIDQSTITDLEFLNDTLIVFTTTGTKAINLKKVYTVLENIPEVQRDYTVNYTAKKYLGTDQTEGIQGTLTFEVTP